MKMNLHIKEVVFRGVPLRRSDLPAIQAAIHQQLAQRLHMATLADNPADLFVDQTHFDFESSADPTQLALNVADSIFPPTEGKGGGGDV